MSNALAVASVSFVLVDLLNNGLIDRDISSTGVGDVAVTALPPDVVESANQGQRQQSQLNLFLYNITQNPGWRSIGLPSRDAAGTRISNPPLALDLHYLLTAYGAQQLHAEILLGYGMQLLHETPVLTREAIRRSLSGPTQVGSGLPSSMLNLFTSELAEQVELIKIWPQTLTTEEISRLWTSFQAHYRPTAAYQASVVLIESRASAKSALPVRARTVKVQPLQRPVILEVLSQAAPNAPIEAVQKILPGYNLVLRGSQLAAERTVVLFGDIEQPPAQATAQEIIVPLPVGLEAGVQTVQVMQPVLLGSPLEEHRGVESNLASFVLSPILQVIAPNVTAGGRNPLEGNFDLTVSPPIGASQRARLLLNQLVPPGSGPAGPPAAYSFDAPPRISLASPPPAPPPPSPNLTIPFRGMAAGTYLARVVVDDAESDLGIDPAGAFSGPTVTIP